MQRALWTSQRLHPNDPVQNMALLTHIQGVVDAERLAESFSMVVAASDALRTRIVDDAGTPVVRLDADPQDKAILTIARGDAVGWAERRVAEPIDLGVRGYDSAVLVHEDGTTSWYLALHHAITDATSSALVFDATAAVYRGEPVELDSYYRWADERTNDGGSGRGIKATRHWSSRPRAEALDRLYQPVRRPTAEAVRLDIDLDPTIQSMADERLSADYRMISPDLATSTMLVTATAAFLSAVTRSSTFSIGLPVHNRGDGETRQLIGPIMEVFPVDVTVEPGQTFRALHRSVGRSIMKTLANAVPGTAPTGDYGAVVNVIARAGVGSFGDVPTTTTWVHSGAIDSAHLLRVQYTSYERTMALDLNTAAAGVEHRARVADHLRSILSAMLTDPDQLVGGPSLTADEQRALRRWEVGPASDRGSQDGQLANDDASTVVDRLRTALAGSDQPALTDGSVTLTGEEVWESATGCSRWLGSQGVGRGSRVGIGIERSADAVVAILATLMAGGSFVPLDPSHPPARRKRLAEQAGTALVLDALPASFDRLLAGDAPTADIATSDEAYLLFTSGSTGEPKGVPITHGGLASYLQFAADSYVGQDASEDRTVAPLFSSLGFDLTMTSLFLPLVAGGELVVIRPDGPAGLAAIAAETRLNWAKATPSHLEVLVRMLPVDHRLHTLVVGGEAFGAGLAERLFEFRDDLRVFNEYGPTEAVVGCMIHRADAGRLGEYADVPIGVPAPGVELRLVGQDLDRVPVGAAGELCISHPGVTTGYLGTDDDHSPFVDLDGRRFYRSGDLVRVATDPADGHLVAHYLGRVDEQVKVGGIRLEPNEVADALAEHPAIERAAVRLWSPASHRAERSGEAMPRCNRCGLATEVPGVTLDGAGICNTCIDYDRVAPQVADWFGTPDDLKALRDQARRSRTGSYDCLHMLSGGKDSTYALYRLVDLGFEPYVFTLDNGFISTEAIENVRRSVEGLGLDHELATTGAMNDIFRDSLERHSNVCHGCYKTLYTLATNRAAELGIPMIMTGLSRGQLFETRLLPQQFAADRFDPDAIDRAVIEARKVYHRIDDGPNRLLDTSVFDDDDLFQRISYVDFYRYVDVELAELYEYLDANAPWVRPSDTGRSTNCLINAAGIHTHQQEQGFHNYAVPYAWDVRLGHKTRDEAIAELDDQLDLAEVGRMLHDVGYTPAPTSTLTAWFVVADGQRAPTPAEIRAFLADYLPAHAVPKAFIAVDALPMNANGKLDLGALPPPERTHRSSSGVQVQAETELEATIVKLWEQILRTEPIGVDDDFFALGGDSLAALEMTVALGDTIGVPLPDDVAFASTTPRDLATTIDELTATAADGAAIETTLSPTGPRAPTGWTDEAPPPLSIGERSILFEQSAAPDRVMYNVGRLYRVAGRIDVTRFTTALETVAAAHVPLSFTYGNPRRRLLPEEAVLVDHSDAFSSEAELAVAAHRFHREPIDLHAGPLVRAMIRPGDDGSTSVVLVCHHASCDAESFDTMWPQIDAHYSGTPIQWPTTDYATFSAWHEDNLTATDRAFWLRDRPERMELALSSPTDLGEDGYINEPATISTGQLRARSGASAYTVAVAALAATLRRYADNDTISLGMIASARNQSAAAGLAGYFLNNLPLDVTCSLDDTLGSVTERTAEAVAANLRHRAYPYAQMVIDRRMAGVEADRGPEVLVVHHRMGSATLGGRQVEQVVLAPGEAVTDATFVITERDDGIELGLEYASDFLDAATAGQLRSDFDRMLTAVATTPDLTIGDVDLPSTERSCMVGPPLSAPSTLLPAIEANWAAVGAAAVECGGDRLSWADLDRRSATLGHRLVAAGIGRNDRVIVNLPRSTDLIAAIVAILRVGAAYVPIDPTYPADRIALLAASSKASAAFVDDDSSRSLALTSNDLPIGADQLGAPAPSTPLPPVRVGPEDTAYVIFTSGSTGTPRGVAVSHGCLAASTTARDGFYERPPARFGLLSSPSFDSSIVGLFWTLATGGTIVLPTDRQSHDPDAIVTIFDGGALSHTLLVPTLYSALLERAVGRASRWPDHVIVAGEECSAVLARRHFELRPSSLLTNEYGPTEATVWVTARHVEPGDDPVPIGEPIPGAWVAVVGPDDLPRPVGVEGELLVGGAGVVGRYDDDEEATARRFGHTELGPFFRTGDRAVISLDLDGGPTVRFAGRVDHQLNVGGVRAEPEDIERVLLAVPGIGAAVVTAHDTRPLAELIEATAAPVLATAMKEASSAQDPGAELAAILRSADPGAVQLVAHLEPTVPLDGDGSISTDQIDVAAVRTLVNSTLPALLRPSRYCAHVALPRTPNGKIDRAAAAHLDTDPVNTSLVNTAADRHRPVEGAGGQGPLNELCELFASTLKTERVTPDQSFFDLGGHSLLAMELLAKIDERYGADITVASLYDNPTPTELAPHVARLVRADDQNRYLIPIQPNGTKPPLFGVHVLGVNSSFYRPLAARLGDDQPLFGLGQPTLALDTSAPTDVAEIASRYADELVECAPDGPVALAGVSLGSVVAYELAQQLRRRGRTVLLLALFDAAGPAAAESGLSIAERLATHGRELLNDPLGYSASTASKLRDRAARRVEIVTADLRESLGLRTTDDQRIRRFIEANWHSQHTYDHIPYDGAVTVFKAADDPFNQRLVGGGMGWRSVVRGRLDVVLTPGGHLSMLAEPDVGSLASRLAEALDKAAAETLASDRSELTVGDLERSLITSVHAGQLGPDLARWSASNAQLSSDASRLLADVDATARGIAANATTQGALAVDALRRAGLTATLEPVPDRLPFLSAGLRVGHSPAGSAVERPGPRRAAVAAALADLGYRPQDELGADTAAPTDIDGRARVTFIRTDRSTTRLVVTIDDVNADRPYRLAVDRGSSRPTAADRARRASRRLVARLSRVSDASDRPTDLGVYLGTPTAMVGDILAIADPATDDLVVDLGCGDGRVLIEAAERFGCSGRGVEIDPTLAAEARRNVEAAGLSDSIDIVTADASGERVAGFLADATIVFLFLPAQVTGEILSEVLRVAPKRADIVAHEQAPLGTEANPIESRLVVGDGLTVVHRWQR
jgi:amino acid adenylation domain-containing protein